MGAGSDQEATKNDDGSRLSPDRLVPFPNAASRIEPAAMAVAGNPLLSTA